MQGRNLGQDARAGHSQANANRATIADAGRPAHKPRTLQFIYEADCGVVLHLKAIAKLSDCHSVRAAERFQSKERFVLFRSQLGFGRKDTLAKVEELPHRVSEISQRLVIVGKQLRIHVSTITGL